MLLLLIKVNDIKNSYPANNVEITTDRDITAEIEKENLVIEKNIDNNYIIKIDNEEQAYKLINKLVTSNVKVSKFEVKRPSLNDIFIEKVGE